MTVFDFEVMSSATSTPKKDGGCACGEMTSFSTFRDLSTEFSFRSPPGDTVCEKADDVCEAEADVKWRADSECGTALLHDHSYTKWQPRKVSSASLDSSCHLDESLQNLFDTCEIDREFLAEAKPAFRQFLDDVLDNSDVPPTDDLFFYQLDDSCRVPTRSSSICLAGPPTSPCLFTSAGSTDTTLSASVAGLRVNDTSSLMASSSPVPLFDCSSSSSPSSSLCSSAGSFSADASSSFCDLKAPSASDCHALDSKLKDVIDFLFTDKNAAGVTKTDESEVTSFLKEMDDVTQCCGGQQPLSFSDTVADDFVWPVTVSHRIQNGVCVSCSAPPNKQGEGESERLLGSSSCDASPRSIINSNTNNDNNNVVIVSPVTAPAPAAQQPRDSHHSSSPLSSTATSAKPCLKRKASDSEESERRDKRARLEEVFADTDTDEACSRLALSAPTTSTTAAPTSDHACVVVGGGPIDDGAVSAAHKVPLLLDLSEDAVTEKRRDGVLDYLSFVGSSKLPLSPIHHHHFGRHG